MFTTPKVDAGVPTALAGVRFRSRVAAPSFPGTNPHMAILWSPMRRRLISGAAAGGTFVMAIAMVLTLSLPAAAADDAEDFPMADGPARPDLATLELYECPDWFSDAKFGIRTQWGPQSVPEMGDGYASNFATPGRRAYDHHVAHFGAPGQFGYEAVVERWTAEKFDPAALAQRFAAAGARYVVALAADRDGVDLWPSTHREMNAVNHGPHRDIVGAWAEAVRAAGLQFGVSEHPAPVPAVPTAVSDPAAARRWYARMHELVERYRPDLLYVVGQAPSTEAGRYLQAHFYNSGIAAHDDLTGVFAARTTDDAHIAKTGAATIERGSLAAIAEAPWQCDTLLNDWVYDRGLAMRPATPVIHQLVDVVSKNGNLLLNVPLRADGSLPDEAGAVLDEIGAWLQLNREAIYGTHPWRIYGEGPTETVGGPQGEKQTLPYTPDDIRYTAKTWYDQNVPHETIYAIVLGWPGPREEVVLEALADGPNAQRIGTVRLLGFDGALRVVRDRHGLHILLPTEAPSRHAIVFRID